MFPMTDRHLSFSPDTPGLLKSVASSMKCNETEMAHCVSIPFVFVHTLESGLLCAVAVSASTRFSRKKFHGWQFAHQPRDGFFKGMTGFIPAIQFAGTYQMNCVEGSSGAPSAKPALSLVVKKKKDWSGWLNTLPPPPGC